MTPPEWVQTHPDLGPSAKLVAFSLWSCARPGKPDVWPSRAWLAERTGLSQRTVQRALGALESIGAVSVVRLTGRTAVRRVALGDRSARSPGNGTPGGTPMAHQIGHPCPTEDRREDTSEIKKQTLVQLSKGEQMKVRNAFVGMVARIGGCYRAHNQQPPEFVLDFQTECRIAQCLSVARESIVRGSGDCEVAAWLDAFKRGTAQSERDPERLRYLTVRPSLAAAQRWCKWEDTARGAERARAREAEEAKAKSTRLEMPPEVAAAMEAAVLKLTGGG